MSPSAQRPCSHTTKILLKTSGTRNGPLVKSGGEPRPGSRKETQLVRLPRPFLSSCTQWITGFCNLMRHRHKKDESIPDKCRLCGIKRETPAAHLSFHCPKLSEARRTFFSSRTNHKKEWTPNELADFISKTVCQDLMVDHTDYDEISMSDEVES